MLFGTLDWRWRSATGEATSSASVRLWFLRGYSRLRRDPDLLLLQCVQRLVNAVICSRGHSDSDAEKNTAGTNSDTMTSKDKSTAPPEDEGQPSPQATGSTPRSAARSSPSSKVAAVDHAPSGSSARSSSRWPATDNAVWRWKPDDAGRSSSLGQLPQTHKVSILVRTQSKAAERRLFEGPRRAKSIDGAAGGISGGAKGGTDATVAVVVPRSPRRPPPLRLLSTPIVVRPSSSLASPASLDTLLSAPVAGPSSRCGARHRSSVPEESSGNAGASSSPRRAAPSAPAAAAAASSSAARLASALGAGGSDINLRRRTTLTGASDAAEAVDAGAGAPAPRSMSSIWTPRGEGGRDANLAGMLEGGAEGRGAAKAAAKKRVTDPGRDAVGVAGPGFLLLPDGTSSRGDPSLRRVVTVAALTQAPSAPPPSNAGASSLFPSPLSQPRKANTIRGGSRLSNPPGATNKLAQPRSARSAVFATSAATDPSSPAHGVASSRPSSSRLLHIGGQKKPGKIGSASSLLGLPGGRSYRGASRRRSAEQIDDTIVSGRRSPSRRFVGLLTASAAVLEEGHGDALRNNSGAGPTVAGARASARFGAILAKPEAAGSTRPSRSKSFRQQRVASSPALTPREGGGAAAAGGGREPSRRQVQGGKGKLDCEIPRIEEVYQDNLADARLQIRLRVVRVHV